ncbi:phosphatase PAP2 family protein [Streptomyces sp. NPDC001781]
MSPPARRLALAAALLTGLPALLFALLTWQVLAHGPLLALDARLSRHLVHPDRFSELLSDLGDVAVAVPVLVLAAGHAAWRGRSAGTPHWWLPSGAAALLTAVLPAIVVPLKLWTARPGTPAVPPATGYFPSGHTATAAVAYGASALLVLPWCRTRAARLTAMVVPAALVLAVSYGLVRRGFHWPLDVLASWCLGAVLLTCLSLVLNRSCSRRSAGTPGPRTGPGSPARSSAPAARARPRGSGTGRGSSSS